MWVWAAFLLGPVLGLQEELLLPLSAPVAPVATISESDVDVDSRCFAVRPTACPPLGETCRCKKIDNESAVCCHISAHFQLSEGLGCEGKPSELTENLAVKNLNLTKLHIWNATLPSLSNLSSRSFTSITVSQSRLERVGLAGNVNCLNISGNAIANLTSDPDAFLNLPNLEFLSLESLNLTRLPRFEVNVTLDLSGNHGLECGMLLQYLEDYPRLEFVNENTTFCFTPKTFHWFNSTELMPLAQVRILKNIKEECTPGCKCQPHSLDVVPGKMPRLTVTVDCSSMGLQALPKNLPTNTISLNVSNNNITCLDPLANDETYQHITIFYADSNHISSILALEGSKFIANFLILSLKDNHIKSLPTYILSNTFDRNYHCTVSLGFNKFSCNCSVAQGLKLWLLGNKKHIPDYDQIYCDNMVEKVVELDANKVCVYERDWTDYIYYIIAGEVGLLLLLVGKVSYDYWVFKTAGYLPWPASKMPKLPCDWVFE